MHILPGTHLVVTHAPPIVPGNDGSLRENGLVETIVQSRAALCVSGHCHWAYGLYYPRGLHSTAFAVASSCDSKWERLISLRGERSDKKWDMIRGGYNLHFLPIVYDLPNLVLPKKGARWKME